MSGTDWLRDDRQKTAAIRLSGVDWVNPDGMIPALTGLRKIGTAADGAELYVPAGEGEVGCEWPFLLSDMTAREER